MLTGSSCKYYPFLSFGYNLQETIQCLLIKCYWKSERKRRWNRRSKYTFGIPDDVYIGFVHQVLTSCLQEVNFLHAGY